ncbi:MAG: metal-dependent hydrolase [Bradymonadia bacterium]
MDNLTHGLAGAALAEAVLRFGPGPLRARTPEALTERRGLYLLTSVVANNAPDLDLVLSPLLPAPLGYLMHHRGHTHTLGFLPLQLVVVLGLVALWPSLRRRLRDDPGARWGALLLAGLGLGVHLGLDALNSYGVHPFWPFHGRWSYGDLVFIVEPVLWAAFGAPVAALARGRIGRGSLLALMVGVPVAAGAFGLVFPVAAVAVLGLVGGLFAVTRRVGAGAGLAAGLASALAFLAIQAQGQAGAATAARAAASAPGVEVDLVLSPLPSNPLCWSWIRVTAEAAANQWHLERGVVSANAEWVPTAECPQGLGATRLEAAREQGDLRALASRAREDCHLDTWLRFARAPSVNVRRATDWRFIAQGEQNFSTLALDGATVRDCPGPIPGWARPRQDLLDLAR